MASTKFSIVTISYNQKQFLAEAITSVLNQDHPGLEYIVVDPGSTDGSRDLIEFYRTRLAAVIFEPDQGAADGLNKGFARATGEVFGFLNSDDFLLPGALASVDRAFEQDPSCDIVMGNGLVVDTTGKPIRHVRAAGFSVNGFFFGGASWLQQSTFFRRRAYEAAGGFNAANRSCWDGELVMEMVAHGSRIHYLDRDLSCFRIHPDSITGSRKHKTMMQPDTSRMFRRTYGRSWNRLDSIRSWLVRVRRLAVQPGALESAIRARMGYNR